MKKNNEVSEPKKSKIIEKPLKVPNNTPDTTNPNYQYLSPTTKDLDALKFPVNLENSSTTDFPKRNHLPKPKLQPKKKLQKN